jgi:hypothetical protein
MFLSDNFVIEIYAAVSFLQGVTVQKKIIFFAKVVVNAKKYPISVDYISLNEIVARDHLS